MPMRKYYCDYCDKQFQDTPADRKRHERGIQHQQAKARWYDSFKHEESQETPKPLCYHFVNTGFCRFGESCKYFHPNANNVAQPTISGPKDILQSSMASASNNIRQPSTISTPSNIPQQSTITASTNILQSSMISTLTTRGNVVPNIMGMSWDNLPPSLRPPPEGGYPSLPFVDWG